MHTVRANAPDVAPQSLFVTLQALGWTAFGVAMALSRVGRYPIDYMVATKVVLAASGVIISLALRAIYRRVLRDDDSHVRLVAITAATSYLAALVWTAFYNHADAALVRTMFDKPVYINSIAALTAGSVYHAFVLLAWSIFYVAIKRHFALEAERSRALRAEALAHHARLQALRLQLQPHFLFNTLNALSTLIVEGRTADASRMVSRIADFLRLTLTESTAEMIPLDDEIEYARRYLDIERVRFGDRLTVHIVLAAAVQRALVPSLILQPLVENAVRHGIANDERRGQVTIAARSSSPGRLLISITNTGAGVATSSTNTGAGVATSIADTGAGAATAGTGVGITNTRARLEQLFGDAQRLTMTPTEKGGMTVEIEMPLNLQER